MEKKFDFISSNMEKNRRVLNKGMISFDFLPSMIQ